MGKLIDDDEFYELLLSDAITDEQRKFAERVKYAMDKAPGVQLESSKDTISREAVECILQELYEVCTNIDEFYHCIDDNVRMMPSIKSTIPVKLKVTKINKHKSNFSDLNSSEQKTGKWVKIHGFCTPGGDPVWQCSECGKGVHVYGIEAATYQGDISDYQWVACPNCGAVMYEE